MRDRKVVARRERFCMRREFGSSGFTPSCRVVDPLPIRLWIARRSYQLAIVAYDGVPLSMLVVAEMPNAIPRRLTSHCSWQAAWCRPGGRAASADPYHCGTSRCAGVSRGAATAVPLCRREHEAARS